MKRVVLLLMSDLAEDGCLGKTKFVAPHSPVKSLEISSKYCGVEAPDCHHEILRANLQLPFPQSRSEPTKPAVQQSRKLIVTSHLSSAGGLPG
jgi:hypothetical protein